MTFPICTTLPIMEISNRQNFFCRKRTCQIQQVRILKITTTNGMLFLLREKKNIPFSANFSSFLSPLLFFLLLSYSLSLPSLRHLRRIGTYCALLGHPRRSHRSSDVPSLADERKANRYSESDYLHIEPVILFIDFPFGTE